MKRRKNNLTFILVLVLAFTLMTAATAAASSTETGYEAFKEALDTIDHDGGDGGTGTISVEVTDNGEEIFAMDGEGICDGSRENFSATATVSDGNAEKDLEIYGIDGAVYLIDSTAEGYYTFDHEEETDSYYEEETGNHQMTAIEEELLDHFVGDLKENFSVTETDNGGSRLQFTMEESEVPTGLNLMIKAALAAEHKSEDGFADSPCDFPFLEEFDFEDRPELVEDVTLQAFEVTIDVDEDDTVAHMDLFIELTGYDADGGYHDVTVSVEREKNSEEGTPSTIDVNDYDWEVVTMDDHHKRIRHCN